jgi:hypothetical protein
VDQCEGRLGEVACGSPVYSTHLKDLHTSSEWYETTDFHSRPGLCETIHLLPEPSTVFEATQGVAVGLAQFWGKCEADICSLPRNMYSAHIYKCEDVS